MSYTNGNGNGTGHNLKPKNVLGGELQIVLHRSDDRILSRRLLPHGR